MLCPKCGGSNLGGDHWLMNCGDCEYRWSPEMLEFNPGYKALVQIINLLHDSNAIADIQARYRAFFGIAAEAIEYMGGPRYALTDEIEAAAKAEVMS